MKKWFLTLLILGLCSGIANSVPYILNNDDIIDGVINPEFSGYVQFSSHTPVSNPPTGNGFIYYSDSDKHIYLRNDLGIDFDLTTGGGGGGASTLIVQFEDVSVSSAAAILNFEGDFILTESPATKVNIVIDTTTLLAAYLSSTTIANTYLSQSSATVTYLNINTAANTYLTQSSATITYLNINTAVNTYLTQSSATVTYLQLSSATATYWQTAGWEQYFSYDGSNYEIDVSTSLNISGDISAITFFGSGANLTGIISTHNALTGLQGGDSGALTNSDNVPFTTPANYTYNAGSITVTGGVAKLIPSGSGSTDWPLTTASSYTYNASSITVTGGVAKLLQPQTTVYAHWHLNESAGSSAADASGNGRTGTLVNMEDGDWQAGKLNNALVFGGSNEYVNCGNIGSFERTDAFSLECWIKTSAVNDIFLSKCEQGGNYRGYFMQTDASGRINPHFISVFSGSHDIIVRGTIAITDNVWHHVVITYDGSAAASGVKIYLDGTLETMVITKDNLDGTMLNSVNFQISGRDGTTSALVGSVDEVLIYDKEISQADVTARWNSGTGTESLSSTGSYFTTNPSIYNDFGHVFTSSVSAFIETSNVSGSDDIKYHCSVDDGSTWQYWTGAIWATTNDSYTQANTDVDVNTNIADLGASGTFRWRALLHSNDGSTTPELDNIQINVGIGYSTGSYVIEMKNDIQPTNNYDYLTLTETALTPSGTIIEYQYSTDSGSIWNGSWLSSTTLTSALQALSPVGDGTDTLLLKFQLTTTNSNNTPELDNVNITSDAGTGSAFMYHLSSTPYLNLTNTNAQLDALHTDGHPTFSSITITNIANATCTYSQNSDLLDGHNFDYFLSTTTAGSTYLTQSSATVSYLHKNAKADDSNLLDGFNYDYFLGTTTASTTYLSQSSATATYLQPNGDGSQLIGIDTLFDISENSSVKISSTDTVRFDGTYFDVDASSIGIDIQQIKTDVDTDTQNEKFYSIVIATYSGNGIDYDATARSTFTAQDAFQLACDNASAGEVIYVKGGTYVFSASFTCTTSDIFIITDGAVIQADSSHYGSNVTNDSTMFFIDNTVSDITIDGFLFDCNSRQVTAIQNKADDFYIKNITIKDSIAGSNIKALYLHADGDNGYVENLNINNCDSANAIDADAKDVRFHNIIVKDSAGLCEFFGTQSVITNVSLFNSARWGLGAATVLDNFLYQNNSVNDWGFVCFGGNNTTISNGYMDGSSYKHAIWINGVHGCIISNINFTNVGDLASNTANAIQVDGSNNVISSCRFNNTIDKYCVEFGVGDVNNLVTGNNMNGISGNLGYINDGSGSHTNRVINNIPIEANYEILVSSTSAMGNEYPNLTPPYIGTIVVNDGSYNIYISTGTGQYDWEKIGGQ